MKLSPLYGDVLGFEKLCFFPMVALCNILMDNQVMVDI